MSAGNMVGVITQGIGGLASPHLGLDPTVRDSISRVFDQSIIRQDVTRATDGFQPKYIPITEVIKRLNQSLNGAWTFELVNQPMFFGRIVVVHGRLTIWYWHNDQRVMISRDQYGQCFMKMDEFNNFVDVGYDLKAAASDALKKCATTFGLALELYERDESAMQGLMRGGSEGQGSFPSGNAYAQTGVQPWQLDSLRKVLGKAGVSETAICEYLKVQNLESISPQQIEWAFKQYSTLKTSAA